MRAGFLGGLTAWLGSAAFAWGQWYLPAPPQPIQPVVAFTRVPGTPPMSTGGPRSYQAYGFAPYEALPQRPAAIQAVQAKEGEFLPPAPTLEPPKNWTPPTPKGSAAPDGKDWLPLLPKTQPEPKGTPGWVPPGPTAEPPSGKDWTPPTPKSEDPSKLKGWLPAPTPETPHTIPAPPLVTPPAGPQVVPHPGQAVCPVSAQMPVMPPEPPEPYMVGYCDVPPHRFHDLFTPNPKARGVMYARAEFIAWMLQHQDVSATATTGLGGLEHGETNVGSDSFLGPRLTVGRWLHTAHPIALEASGFFLGRKSDQDSQTFEARALTDGVLFDGILSENSVIRGDAQFWGAEAGFRGECWRFCHGPWKGYIDMLSGFRYLDLDENLSITSVTAFAPGALPLSGATVTTLDRFSTHNRIYAGQVGLEAMVQKGNWALLGYGKVGIGGNRQNVRISGQTTLANSTVFPNQTVDGGFLAQPTNSGDFERNQLCLLWEAGFTLQYEVRRWCRLGLGYNFLSLSHVARPADEITPVEAARPALFFLGAGARPTPSFQFNDSSFWAQGIHAQLELTY